MRLKALTVVAGLLASLLAVSTVLPALGDEQPVERLGVPGPINFGGLDYQFAWSSHPTAEYYKQEYVPEGQTLEQFQSMLLIEVLASGSDVNAAVTDQIAMLDKRKATDALVNYDVIQNKQTGEVLLDFLMSQQQSDGVYLVEWNAYRYARYADPSGKKGVTLVAISERAYGNQAAKQFLNTLKDLRGKRIGELIGLAMPAVNPAP